MKIRDLHGFVCVLGVWTCILGVWTCISGVGTSYGYPHVFICYLSGLNHALRTVAYHKATLHMIIKASTWYQTVCRCQQLVLIKAADFAKYK